MLLEETLSPFSSPKEQKRSDEATLLKDLNEIPHCYLESGKISLPAETPDINMCREKLQKEKSEINKEDIFLNMNKIGDTEEDFELKALLDSPLIINKCNIDDDNLQIKSILHTLPKLQVHESDTNGFLKPAEIDLIKERIWQKEKYFSDILSMRITEPEIQVPIVSYMSLQTVIQQQKLVKEDHIGETELSLSWDPVGNSACNIEKTLSTTEKIDLTVKENIYSEVFQIKFEKFQYSDMHCVNDDVIEVSNTNNISDMKNDEEVESESIVNQPMMVSSFETVKEVTQDVVSANEEDFGFSQIDDFFTLRIGAKPQQQKKSITSRLTADAVKPNPESGCVDRKRPVDNNKIWSDIITVQLGGISQIVAFW
ncbi:uncharacterized protein LOC127738671 [Mytilus californianus]|uniref:uncharacterized protein LOC127738671 n=1 Tax=Mytilus californianus TaxID=6549 RepID=UPI00224746AF|nr:uncharacterized protein LOC127738671 [Mytilus californianus]